MALSAPASKRRCNPYVYEKLCDLHSRSSGVNVMGVVTLFKPPYKSKGSDFTCTFEIVDEGCASSPFPLIFFNRDVNKLPQSCSVGDVLCVRRVDVSEFNQRLQGKCRHFCSWLVWGGGREGRREPGRTSEGTSWDPDERSRADQLIRWSASLNSVPQASGSHQPSPITQSPTASQSPLTTALKPIADLSLTDKKINFVGVVKSVSAPQKSKGPDYFISVTLIDETSSTEGLTFTFFNPREDQLPKLGDPGSVAFLRNMSISDYQGSLLGRGHQRSKAVCFSLQPDGALTPTAGSDSEVPGAVRDRAKALLGWVASAELQLGALEDSEMESQPSAPHPPPGDHSLSSKQSDPDLAFIPPTFLTLVLHPTWKINALSDVQTYPKVPSCFRVRVKVLQVLQPLEECCQLRCSQCKYKFAPTKKVDAACGHCKREGKSGSLRYMFCLSLLVRDTTTSVTVHLSDTDADEFFQDLPPANLHDNPSTRESLQKILNSLTGGHDPFLPIQLSPLSDKRWPWIDCCLQTYSSCKGTQFRIVDTWFVTRV